MSEYIKYRFCPNVTCDNHINKKKFKSGAEVCGECGFQLKDYDFDPVTRTILNYDDEEREETAEVAPNKPTPQADVPIDFGSIPDSDTPLFDTPSSSEPIKDTISETVATNELPVDAEKEMLKKQLEQMALQMAQMQELLNKSEIKPKEEPISPNVQDKAPTMILPTPIPDKSVTNEPESSDSDRLLMTDEEIERTKQEVRETVAKELELERIKKERERERASFERAYNEKRKAKQELIEEERKRQKAIIQKKEYGEDPAEEPVSEEKELNLNADGFYNSYEPMYEELYKKSKKKTIYQVVSLGVVIFIVLYAVLYITS